MLAIITFPETRRLARHGNVSEVWNSEAHCCRANCVGDNSKGGYGVLLTRRGRMVQSALSGRRGGVLRADCIENSSGSLLDVCEALFQKFRISLVQLDVVLRC